MRILELFAGIGACSTALKRLGIDLEIVDAVEIDKYAIESFNAIHGTNFETQDICTWDKDIEVDLITHGSPCQDFSVAGKQAGGDEGSGTRSSLMYETIRIVKKLKPKYVLWENVKNILSKKHKHNFDAYLEAMEKLGYRNYYQVLNAKDYGIPQNRERVYTVSVLSDVDYLFTFPKKQQLKLRLKDMLEDNVDEKYFLSDSMKKYIFSEDDKYKVNKNGLKLNREIACSKTTREGNTRADTSDYILETCLLKNKGKELTKITENANTLMARDWKDTKCVRIGGIFDTEKSKHQAGSIYDKEGLSPTLDIMQGGWRQPSIVNNYRIRKLTPKECWRLMGFDDEDFEKAQAVPMSNTQLYKQAGNSIVVNVLENIFRELF